jgi:hypothetical protein
VPRILGYGEDFLTFLALYSKLPTLLKCLGDDSAPDEAVLVYRPSFGRGGSNKALRAVFGEFDAIIGTPRRVYPVETKWEGSSVRFDGTLRINQAQVTRHRVFEAYRTKWRESPTADWTDFVSRHGEYFSTELHLKIAPTGSILARNLEFVLKQLAGCGPETQHVVLFIHLDEPKATRVEPDHFKLVTLRADRLPDSMYVEVALPHREMEHAEKQPWPHHGTFCSVDSQ